MERLPSDPMFRNKVRPDSGSHRIPQLMTPGSEVIQDSVEIVDRLEQRFPDLPAFPDTPRQRVFVHLMELMASEGLVRLAWLHRWMFEENFSFVKKDFGRSFKPQGSDEELLRYGNLISDRMMSYGLPESTEESRNVLDKTYGELLSLFELHLTEYPYFPLNPSSYWCYSDEELVGEIIDLAHTCHPSTLGRTLLFKWLHLYFEEADTA